MILAFACFVGNGLAGGLFGVAWPSIRGTFGLPLDALVLLLATSTIGFVAGSVLAGKLMARLGIGRLLIIANVLAAIWLWAFSLSPGWGLLVAFGLMAGWTGGTINTSLNVYVAASQTIRTMNWMHASYGIGATIGPLLMTGILGANLSWRLGYALAGFIHLSLALSYFFILDRLNFRGIKESGAAENENVKVTPAKTTIRLPVVWLSVLLFLLYTGVEATTGQWSYSLFVEERSISPYLAGIMTSLFWAMLTVGRIVFGAAATRIGVERLLRLSLAGAVMAAVLFLSPSPVISFFTIGLMGLSLSAIFPTLTSDTPNRVGLIHANNAIGFQTGAASVGVACLPGLAGVLAERRGLEIIGPFLIVSALLLAVTNEIVLWIVRRRAREELVPWQSVAD